MAASKIVQATRGEIRWASREEDSKKKDLYLSSQHPWYPTDRLEISIQVKSGPSNGRLIENGFRLKKQAYKDLIIKKDPTCLLWVDYDTGRTYWTYVHPSSDLDSHNEFSNIHLVSPATIYDLARCAARHKGEHKRDGRGVNISSKDIDKNLLIIRAKEAIQRFKYEGQLFCPVLGCIEFTRTSWRHMFRASRKKANRESSLRVIPHLAALLSQIPSTHFISEYEFEENRDMITRSLNHIIKYTKASQNNRQISVVIKVQEDVRYPVNWRERTLLSQLVERKLTLISCYTKTEQ